MWPACATGEPGNETRGNVQSYEVAIVGGAPAGLSTALFLTDAAPHLKDRIVVLEKSGYPREKICAGGIGARGDNLLRSIGVRVDVPSVDVTTLSMRSAHGSAVASVPTLGRVVRRAEYDHALARAAQARGIRIMQNVKVDRLERSRAGYELTTSDGDLRARVVVGADGVTGITRRAVGLRASRYRAQVIELDTSPVASDLPRDTLHFDFFDPSFTGYAWDFPTIVDGEAMVCRGVYHLKTHGETADIQQVLAERLAERGLDITHYRNKRFAECGFEPHASYAAPHVVLVGEAAGIDAFSGEGIAQAIEYGAFAGRYLADKLTGSDFSFADWRRRFARSAVGVDLANREWWMQVYFGRARCAIEKHVASQVSYVRGTAKQLTGEQLAATWHFLQAVTAGGRSYVADEARRALRTVLQSVSARA